MHPTAGSLLISSASLVDPNFARTLVLLLSSDPDGALGVVLNHPSRTAVGEVLADWQLLTTEPGVLFSGGPVEPQSALAVAAHNGVAPASGWRELSGSLGLIDLDAPADSFVGLLSAVRVYAGYSGWGAGQLEAEIEEGSWHVVPAVLSDLFSDDPGRLWSRVLRRQSGDLALMSTMPVDPTLN